MGDFRICIADIYDKAVQPQRRVDCVKLMSYTHCVMLYVHFYYYFYLYYHYYDI